MRTWVSPAWTILIVRVSTQTARFQRGLPSLAFFQGFLSHLRLEALLNTCYIRKLFYPPCYSVSRREHTHSISPGQRPHEAPGATAVFLPLATRSQLKSKEYTEQSSKRWFFFQLPTRWIAWAAKAEGFWGRRLEGLVGRQPMCGQMRRSLYFGSICAVSRQMPGAGMRGAGSCASGRGRRKRSPAQHHLLTPLTPFDMKPEQPRSAPKTGL